MPDQVNCARLAEDAAGFERVYELADLPRLRDLLADPRGTVTANFAFATLANGRVGAEVAVRASPWLICQRCLEGFEFVVNARSEVEFAAADDAPNAESERELVVMQNGCVSLRGLAEEELLLALPIAPACGAPLDCGSAAADAKAGSIAPTPEGARRPFDGLRDLLKKT